MLTNQSNVVSCTFKLWLNDLNYGGVAFSVEMLDNMLCQNVFVFFLMLIFP